MLNPAGLNDGLILINTDFGVSSKPESRFQNAGQQAGGIDYQAQNPTPGRVRIAGLVFSFFSIYWLTTAEIICNLLVTYYEQPKFNGSGVSRTGSPNSTTHDGSGQEVAWMLRE